MAVSQPTLGLQPVDITLFQPIKTYCYQEATNFRQRNSDAAVTKFGLGKHLSTAGRKRLNICKRSWVHRRIACEPSVLPKIRFCHVHTFYKIQPTFCRQTHVIRSCLKSVNHLDWLMEFRFTWSRTIHCHPSKSWNRGKRRFKYLNSHSRKEKVCEEMPNGNGQDTGQRTGILYRHWLNEDWRWRRKA